MVSMHIYQPGAVPSPATWLECLGGQLDSYAHTISATGGFESCQASISVGLDEAFAWLSRLGGPVICAAPDGSTIWEGMLTGLDLRAGDESLTQSLDDMANAVAVRYQPGIGQQATTAWLTDAASIARYGRKELLYSGSGMSAASAANLATALLAQRRNPVSRRSSTVTSGSRSGEVRLTVSATGWYYLLDWLTTSSTSTTSTSTTTQVQNLTTAFNAVNAWISTDYRDIVTSGVSDTEQIEPGTTYRKKIERLMSQGDSAGQRLAYGIYEDRRWTIRRWGGAAPATIAYQRSLGDGLLRTAAGMYVDPWLVRPDAMYRVQDFATSDPVATDSLESYYIERITYQMNQRGQSLRLEPARSDALDVLLARMR